MINLILIAVFIIFFIISIYTGILPIAEYDRNTVDNITNSLVVSAANRNLLNASKEYLTPEQYQILINNEIMSERENINKNIQNAKIYSTISNDKIKEILFT